jgi:hypothetical protein
MTEDARQRRARELADALSRGDFARARELLGQIPAKRSARGDASRASRPKPEPEFPPDALPPAPRSIGPPAGPLAGSAACGDGTDGGQAGREPARACRIDWTLEDLWGVPGRQGCAATVFHELRGAFRGAGERLNELSASAAMCHLASADVGRIGWFDRLAVARRSGRWLVASLAWLGEEAVSMCHWIAPGVADEQAVVGSLTREIEAYDVIVSFAPGGGLAKDLAERQAALGVEEAWSEPVHLDLRGEARRMWKLKARQADLGHLSRRIPGERYVALPAGTEHQAQMALQRAGPGEVLGEPAGVLVARMARGLVTMMRITAALLTGRQADG